MAVLFTPMIIFGIYLLRNNQALLARRLKAREAETAQRWILGGFFLTFLALFILPGLGYRFGWSSVPTWLVLVADLLVLVGYLLVIVVLLTNEYAARTIEVEAAQPVISSGPYALVRHPMYSAMTVMIVFSALALGSVWALLSAAAFVLLLVARILNEEQVLRRELAGYGAYCQRVTYRLIPGLW
ncbi:MAG: isoprenylcysteine carboxylmethyltransferase family protein [Caldilineaceae bacterium]|nr:isoprenylcysteine carboxylmethyltransferase family protein [Caldilineaceae bacterium]